MSSTDGETNSYKGVEIIIKAVAPVLTVVGILIGVYEFQAGERNTKEREYELIARQDSIEFKRKVWEQQLEVYRNLAGAAGQLSTATGNAQEFQKAADKFEQIYWGTAPLFEDESTEAAFKDLHLAVGDFRAHRIGANELRLAAAAAGDSMRASLARSWGQLRKAAP